MSKALFTFILSLKQNDWESLLKSRLIICAFLSLIYFLLRHSAFSHDCPRNIFWYPPLLPFLLLSKYLHFSTPSNLGLYSHFQFLIICTQLCIFLLNSRYIPFYLLSSPQYSIWHYTFPTVLFPFFCVNSKSQEAWYSFFLQCNYQSFQLYPWSPLYASPNSHIFLDTAGPQVMLPVSGEPYRLCNYKLCLVTYLYMFKEDP